MNAQDLKASVPALRGIEEKAVIGSPNNRPIREEKFGAPGRI
jgi:hypothetical protein